MVFDQFDPFYPRRQRPSETAERQGSSVSEEEIAKVGDTIKLDVTAVAKQGDLCGWYTPSGAPRSERALRIILKKHGAARRGDRVMAEVTKRPERSALATVTEVIGDYLDTLMDKRFDVYLTGPNPLGAGSISVPKPEVEKTGIKGVSAFMETIPYTNGVVAVRITNYRELEAEEFDSFVLDPDLDKYVLLGEMHMVGPRLPW